MNATPAFRLETTGTLGHYIGGRLVPGGKATLPVHNPATGRITRHVALASREDVTAAIGAAEAAFPEWRNTPPAKRARWAWPIDADAIGRRSM